MPHGVYGRPFLFIAIDRIWLAPHRTPQAARFQTSRLEQKPKRSQQILGTPLRCPQRQRETNHGGRLCSSCSIRPCVRSGSVYFFRMNTLTPAAGLWVGLAVVIQSPVQRRSFGILEVLTRLGLHLLIGRLMPSFAIRVSRVVGFTPSRSAAPSAPRTRQFDASSTR